MILKLGPVHFSPVEIGRSRSITCHWRSLILTQQSGKWLTAVATCLFSIAGFGVAHAQMDAIKQAARRSCEAKTIGSLQQQKESGLNPTLPVVPLPPTAPISSSILINSCKAYIQETGKFHPVCPCPLSPQ